MFETNLVFAVLVAAYLMALAWYVIKVVTERDRQPERRRRSRKSAPAKSTSGRETGKRCPQCRTIINSKRTVCQHCGYEFQPENAEQSQPADESEAGE